MALWFRAFVALAVGPGNSSFRGSGTLLQPLCTPDTHSGTYTYMQGNTHTNKINLILENKRAGREISLGHICPSERAAM